LLGQLFRQHQAASGCGEGWQGVFMLHIM
jgi:hypothetical protein